MKDAGKPNSWKQRAHGAVRKREGARNGKLFLNTVTISVMQGEEFLDICSKTQCPNLKILYCTLKILRVWFLIKSSYDKKT